jgi:hypothetical protein
MVLVGTRLAYVCVRWWKWVGLAGLVGAAAIGVGVVISRRERPTVDYDLDELQERLHRRLDVARERLASA